MKRRESLGLLALAPALSLAPVIAWTQIANPSVMMPRIGFLSPTTLEANKERIAALRAGLLEHGWAEGRNLAIEFRFAEGRFERLPELARELARLDLKLIIAINTPGAKAAMTSGGSTPVLFGSVGDPLAVGLVASLARPEGRVTGVANIARDLTAKRLQLLKEALPRARRIAVLTNPDDPVTALQETDLRGAAPILGVELRFFPVRAVGEIDATVKAIAAWRADGVFRVAEPLLSAARVELAQALLSQRLPSMMLSPLEVRAGGLMSYYALESEQYRMLARYVDQMLKGAKPGDLPVWQPTRFELVVNLRTARSLGIAIPQSVLLQATEVIE